MAHRTLIRAGFLALCMACAAAAQEPHQVSTEEAVQHLTKRVEPRYPQMAEVAHIQGTVIVRVTIDENGKVRDAKVVSGHPLLYEAALPAVKEWQFQPFLDNGHAVPVSTLVKVEFSLGPGAELRREYLQQEVECTRQIQSNNFTSAEPACKKALETARKLPRSFESDKMRAYGNAGTAAYGLKKTDEALEDFKQQLAFALQAVQPGNLQMVQARSNLAHAYVATGQLQQADHEYTETEKALDAAVSDLEGRRDTVKPQAFKIVKTSYARNMQVILQEHVTLLRKMGKIPEAQALEERASSLTDNQ